MVTTLLDLPTELLDRIYSYLDWDRTTTLIPLRPDLFALSLTCKHLRHTALPLIFQNVTLVLRWAGGTLLEPALYALRRDRPDLAVHVRCVFVTTTLGHKPGTNIQAAVPHFRVPESVDNWLCPERAVWPDNKHYANLQATHRQRVRTAIDQVTAAVSQAVELDQSDQLMTPEAAVRDLVAKTSQAVRKEGAESSRRIQQSADGIGAGVESLGDTAANSRWQDNGWQENRNRGHRAPEVQRLKLQIDALAAVMLCLPAQLTELVFQVGIHGLEDVQWYHFAIHLAAAALRVFGPRLEHLTIATGAGGRRHSINPHLRRPDEEEDTVDIQPDIIAGLTTLDRLVFASTSGGTFNVNQLHLDAGQLEAWDHASVTATVTRLEFWNTSFHDGSIEGLTKFTSKFESLRTLKFRSIAFYTAGMPSRLRTDPGASVGPAVWLRLAILFRRVIPPTTFMSFSNIFSSSRGRSETLSVSALHWLHTEAVPVGAVIDAQREERLFEDFESFLELWGAEDSGRGKLAMEEWKSGKLVDAAYHNRWRQFENVIQDKGEWLTI